jgi:hypothetical protein
MAKRSGLRGKPETMRRLNKRLQQLSTEQAQATASRIAPVLTRLARQAYDQGKTVYEESRPLGVTGNELDLVETSKTRDHVEFKATGTVVRAVLTTKWAPYLIGKYKILPIQRVPTRWIAEIKKAAGEEFFRLTKP